MSSTANNVSFFNVDTQRDVRRTMWMVAFFAAPLSTSLLILLPIIMLTVDEKLYMAISAGVLFAIVTKFIFFNKILQYIGFGIVLAYLVLGHQMDLRSVGHSYFTTKASFFGEYESGFAHELPLIYSIIKDNEAGEETHAVYIYGHNGWDENWEAINRFVGDKYVITDLNTGETVIAPLGYAVGIIEKHQKTADEGGYTFYDADRWAFKEIFETFADFGREDLRPWERDVNFSFDDVTPEDTEEIIGHFIRQYENLHGTPINAMFEKRNKTEYIVASEGNKTVFIDYKKLYRILSDTVYGYYNPVVK
jgi:hypothetical protein